MEQANHKVEELTKACWKSIVNSKMPCPVIVILGMEVAGKASLIEHIADIMGLSKNIVISATKRPQIISTSILSRETFFIYVPGFSNSNAYEMFHHTAQMIDDLRPFITIKGVWHVIENSLSQELALSSKLLEWLSEFCGKEYYPFITIVTIHWDCTLQEEFLYQTRNFEEQKLAWERILGTGIHTYQHGKWYDMAGQEMDQLPTLSWYEDEVALRMNAREMAERRCGFTNDIQPAFVRELNEGKRIEDTAAARVLQQPSDLSHPPTPNPTPASEPSTPRVTPGSIFGTG